MQDIVHVKGICPTAFFAYTTEKRKPDVEAAPRHHACPQILCSGNFPHIKSVIIFALEKKKICTVSELKSNFQLASLRLSTIGNGTQQNFPQALFSMAHPKPAGKSLNQKFPLACSSSLHCKSMGHLGKIIKYRREGDTSNSGSHYLNCFYKYIFLQILGIIH